VLERDRIHEAIVDTATTRKCDLITMSSHGHRGVAALLLGSVTLKVLTHAKIPVLVHRQN
jgi:nucleotide-binding universal stress UspA family protein